VIPRRLELDDYLIVAGLVTLKEALMTGRFYRWFDSFVRDGQGKGLPIGKCNA
jgi:hypothetical protein